MELHQFLDFRIKVEHLSSFVKMEDTPQHIKDLQLKIWLSKPPGERLRQCIVDSEEFYKMMEQAKRQLQDTKTSATQNDVVTSPP